MSDRSSKSQPSRSRRTLLKTGVLAGFAWLLTSPLAQADEPPSPAPARDVPTRPVTRSLLQPHVGEVFRVETGTGSTVVLTLAEVGDLPSARAAGAVGSDQSFAAVFQTTAGTMLSQGTYDLRHAKLGTLTMFLVPVDRPSTTASYEAIFNRQAK